MKLRLGISLLIVASAHAARAAAPVVYADDNITVRAAVAEVGAAAVHVGDTLTLVVELAFDPDEVQVEALNGDWFGRTFADVAPVALYRTGEPSTEPNGRGGVRLTMQWQFQIVGCPPGLGHCPGAKRYELPLAGVAYRLVSAEDRAAANRSARFTPWPDSITVAPSIAFDPAGDTGIDASIPGGAWPAPKTLERPGAVGAALLAAGGILLVSGLVAGSRRRRRPGGRSPHAHRDSRWERAALRLADDTLDDDAWSDLLRRCLAWYCLDELGRNPVEWLREGAGPPPEPHAADCRTLFLDVLSETGIEAGRRGTFRVRFARVTGTGVRGQ